ncbi:L-xylulose reductase-like [Cylas formicarius]|uniref:L-xylulose reductase-like n=1 Tax=Cylas formicarius TaxID=197179 RepID=UPI002958C4FC|nr:L-xylulose reductase-like [Cylas formicarius]
MAFDFKGKTALVTGVTKGIGRQIAIELSKSNARVIGVGRTKELLAELTTQHPSIKTIALDISDWKKTGEVLSNIGPIDMLVNNAAMGWVKSLMDVTEDDFDSVFSINSKALINVTQIVITNLLARNAPGAIVNLSSQASLVGLMNHTVYCSSKGAVDAFTRAVALEYGPRNIRANSVNPTVIMTEMGRLGWSDPKIKEPMLQKIPLRRFGEIDDVVGAVLFLLSDKAELITGVALPIDGGYVCA